MLRAEAPGALPPPGAFLFDAYFRETQSSFAGASFRGVGFVPVRRPGRTIAIVYTLRFSARIRRGAASLALAKIYIKSLQLKWTYNDDFSLSLGEVWR